MIPVSRSTARGLWPVLPLLLLSSVVSAQSVSSLKFDSAVDSHRQLDEDGAPPSFGADGDAAAEQTDPSTETEGVARESDTKLVADSPAPSDPEQSMVSDEGEPEPESEPSMPKTALPYDSVLSDYVPYEETNGPTWIEANERVGEIGGWRAYARELFEPAPAAADEGDGR